MNIGYTSYPLPANEPVLNYAPGSSEKILLKKTLAELKNRQLEIPMYIGGKEITTAAKVEIHPPHQIKHTLGFYYKGNETHVQQAIDAALSAKNNWENTPFETRAAIFLKAADLISTKYRSYMNAATMLGQSKNVFQAEVDCVCELADFLRFNVHYLNQIYKQQPISTTGVHNRSEYRALEGFVLAITPFNFTSIGGNLAAAPALCGNVVVWKPAHNQIYSAQIFMQILKEAGLPNGVINLIYVDGATVGKVCFSHKYFAGVHFTGSTNVFNSMWETIGKNTGNYKTYPRIVGETGGKDFVVVHQTADVDVVVTALLRGAFEYQGQKCSAASRAYLPSNLAKKIKEKLINGINSFKMGTVENFTNFINAVIDENSFNKIKTYIDNAKASNDAEIIVGGNCDKREGYFIQPTIIEAKSADYVTMQEEIFGPVLTIYIYDENKFEEILDVVNNTSAYALTGSIMATDKNAIALADAKLRHAAGNFYINDKPTGAVVGQQPFGGARASGTNDKAGSALNLYRWLSTRTIKEAFISPTDYKYPFMAEE